jgi:predicted dehydrogenase
MTFLSVKNFPASTEPRVAVIGLGQYYRKLYSGLTRYFDPGVLFDIKNTKLKPSSLSDLISSSHHDAVMLLTPNAVHAEEVAEIADLRLPVFVEKPLATTRSSLELIERSLHTNPLLYCSDFYPDVRAAPLLAWLARSPTWLRDDDLVVQGDMSLWAAGTSMLRSTQRVVSVLREGEGRAGSFDGRSWLWDPIHGGVLWDLAYHYLTLWHIALAQPLTLLRSDLEVIGSHRAGELAETKAVLTLRSTAQLEFQIEAGKYYKQPNERWFRLEGDGWSATMTFGNRNYFVINGAGSSCRATLTGSYYEHVSRAFRHYVDMNPRRPFGFDAAVAAIDLILQAKASLPVYRTPMLRMLLIFLVRLNGCFAG